jgi:hypothetical protein
LGRDTRTKKGGKNQTKRRNEKKVRDGNKIQKKKRTRSPHVISECRKIFHSIRAIFQNPLFEKKGKQEQVQKRREEPNQEKKKENKKTYP